MRAIAFGMAAFFLALIALGNGAQAQYWDNQCVNSTDMVSTFKPIDNNTGTYLVNIVDPHHCDYGCNNVTGSCNPIPQYTLYYRGLAVTFMVLVIYLAWVIMKSKPTEKEGM